MTTQIESSTSLLTGKFLLSSWGKKLVVFNGNIYRKKKHLKDGGKSYWTCISEKKTACKVRIHVLEDNSDLPKILKVVGKHTHSDSEKEVESRFAVSRLKRKSLDSTKKTNKFVKSGISQEPFVPSISRIPIKLESFEPSDFQSGLSPVQNHYLNAEKEASRPQETPDQTIVEVNTNRNLVPPLNTVALVKNVLSENQISLQRQQKPLQGKVVLVTGASSGIGQAIAESVASAGANVCIGARRQDKLTSIRQKIEASGGIAHQYDLDVTNRSQFEAVVNAIEENIGPIDILVNNAGVMFYTHMHNAMIDDWDKMIEVNCRGVTNSIGCILPGMVERRKGHIVNISSDAGRKGFAGLGVYSATKFFVEGLSQALRLEVEDKGVRVTCIQPGDVKTEIGNYTKDIEARLQYDSTIRNDEKILDPANIGNAVLYAVTAPDHVGVNEVLIQPIHRPILI